MRSILILTIFGTLLLQPTVSFADASAQCQSDCANEKASRDANCPPPGEDTDQVERSQCLHESQEAYNICLKGCPQPDPIDTPSAN
jgi:hypothetical protein